MMIICFFQILVTHWQSSGWFSLFMMIQNARMYSFLVHFSYVFLNFIWYAIVPYQFPSFLNDLFCDMLEQAALLF